MGEEEATGSVVPIAAFLPRHRLYSLSLPNSLSKDKRTNSSLGDLLKNLLKRHQVLFEHTEVKQR